MGFHLGRGEEDTCDYGLLWPPPAPNPTFLLERLIEGDAVAVPLRIHQDTVAVKLWGGQERGGREAEMV